MMLSRLSSLVLFALVVANALSGVEVIGEAPKFLGDKFRANWHQTTLNDVLKELERFIEKPLLCSANINKLGDSQLITLVDDKKITLREELELLETSQDLHFITEPLRLRVETWEDFRDRKRHPVNLSLRDYGLFATAKDFPGPDLGFHAGPYDGHAGGFNMFKGDSGHSAGREPEPGDVVELLTKISTNGGVELRGHGNVYVLVTDEEEVAMRKTLEDMNARKMRRSEWRVTFGTLPAAETFPSGLIPTADAVKLAQRLQAKAQLSLAAMSGQRVSATNLRQQAQLAGADIVNFALDSRIEVFNSGRSADLRPTLGMNFTWLAYQLNWVDPQESTMSALRNPGVRLPGSTTSTSTDTSKEDPKVKEKEKTTTVSVTTQDAGVHGGESMQIEKNAAWTWQPQGECYIAKDTALVLASENPDGHAIIIVEGRP